MRRIDHATPHRTERPRDRYRELAGGTTITVSVAPGRHGPVNPPAPEVLILLVPIDAQIMGSPCISRPDDAACGHAPALAWGPATMCDTAWTRPPPSNTVGKEKSLQLRHPIQEPAMNPHLSLTPIVSLLAGILILIVPRMLNYIVAIYLILVGLIGLFGAETLHLR
jgi:hypothetical protein